ncbi:MAG: hypothetical protein J2P17_30210 [Mycobacterium sp.]|nr:hypothetical protein [Mycobacterium sp.]
MNAGQGLLRVVRPKLTQLGGINGSSSASSGPAVVADPNGSTSANAADHGGTDGSRNHTGLIITLAIVIVLAALVLFVVSRARRSRAGGFRPPTS